MIKQEEISQETIENAYLKDKIVSIFDKLDTERQKQKNDIKEVEDAIFLKKTDKFQMTDLFELYQTFKAHIWENLYSNLELLFDVKGLDGKSEQTALLQKHNLQKYFEQAKLQNVLDNAIDFLIRKSEAIIFVGWSTKEKFVRRQKLLPILDKYGKPTPKQKKEIVIDKEQIYDGLELKAIDPECIVFDTDNKNHFIHQTFIPFSELETINGFNLLNENVLEEIKKYIKKEKLKEDKIELLEYWGDIYLADGTLAKNQVIVVAAREFIIRKEQNPYVINPFVVMELLKDPDTKRGFVYLKTALPMKDKAQQIFINQLRALEFITNPAYLAPKGAFSKIDQSAEPGKIIEYEASLMPQAPVPLNMSGALQGWEFLNYLKNIEETSTGIFKNFSGVIDKARSATEVQATVGGQNSRLAMIIDSINQYLIIPIIEKSADLIANLIFDEEEIFITDKNGNKTIVIDNSVRQAKYKYIYGDRNAMQMRKFKVKEMFDICTNMFKTFPKLQNSIDEIEALKFVLEQYGYDNFERFKHNENTGRINLSPNTTTEGNAKKQGMENLQ